MTIKLEAGCVYESKTGLQRKIIGFRKNWSSPVRNEMPDTWCDVMYEHMNGRRVGETGSCWSTTFKSWAIRRIDGTGDEKVVVSKAEHERLQKQNTIMLSALESIEKGLFSTRNAQTVARQAIEEVMGTP